VVDRCGVFPHVVGADEVQVAVAERHDNDHRLDLALGEEVIEYEVRPADDAPSRV
jgi:hypothetical protein